MSVAPSSPENDPNLSDIGRALLATGGSKPSGPWVPPTAEELHAILPQYEIVKMLGRGGMGAVYMGRQTALDRPVAIKILSAQLEESDMGFTERFKNEARAMGKLNHPAIVSVYEFGEHASGLLYIVMEYVDGTDVSKMIAKSGRLHTEHAMAITAHVCDALSYAHERGIIHRDIKPANIMVGFDGMVKVADFGLAKVSSSGGQTLGLTQSGMAMGTLHFMAPEALMLGTAVDHRADIYAVGVMLYQMLTGKLPQGMFKMPSLQIAGLDPRYDGVITKAIMEDRELRYQSAREMRSGLDGILTQPVVKVEADAGANVNAAQAAAALPTQARPKRPGGQQPHRPPPPTLMVRTEKKSSLLPWLLVLVLLCGGGYLYFDRSKSKPQTAATTKEKPAAPPSTPLVTSPASPPVALPLPAAPTAPSVPPVADAYAWITGTWLQVQRLPPAEVARTELRSDHSAEMTKDGRTTLGRWNVSEKKLSINWSTGVRHELTVTKPNSVTELNGKGVSTQDTAFTLTYQRDGVIKPGPTGTGGAVDSASDWQALFNGKDLAGWDRRPANMPVSVSDGMLLIRGVDARDEAGLLYYVGKGRLPDQLPELKNFEVVTTLKTTRHGNSGLRFHVRPENSAAANDNSLTTPGIEVQLWNEGKFSTYESQYHTGSLFGIAPVLTSHFRDDEWFEVRLLVDDRRVQVLVRQVGATNWKQVVDWRQPPDWTPPKILPNARLGSGTLAFSNWIPVEGEVWIKEVKFRSLNPAATTPATASPSATPTLWIDTQGRSLKASFVRVEGTSVMLNIAGKITPVALSTLSAASQQIARDLQSALQAAESKTSAKALETSLLGLWWQRNHGNDLPFYPLAFLADGSAGFGWLGKGMEFDGRWQITGDEVRVSWPNGCIYHIDLKSGTPTQRSGYAVGGTPARFDLEITHTEIRPATEPPETNELADLSFDFSFKDNGRTGSNGVLRLLKDGTVVQQSSMNFTSWKVANGFLMLMNSRHECLTLLNQFERKKGKWSIRGQFVPDAAVEHRLEQQ